MPGIGSEDEGRGCSVPVSWSDPGRAHATEVTWTSELGGASSTGSASSSRR